MNETYAPDFKKALEAFKKEAAALDALFITDKTAYERRCQLTYDFMDRCLGAGYFKTAKEIQEDFLRKTPRITQIIEDFNKNSELIKIEIVPQDGKPTIVFKDKIKAQLGNIVWLRRLGIPVGLGLTALGAYTVGTATAPDPATGEPRRRWDKTALGVIEAAAGIGLTAAAARLGIKGAGSQPAR